MQKNKMQHAEDKTCKNSKNVSSNNCYRTVDNDKLMILAQSASLKKQTKQNLIKID